MIVLEHFKMFCFADKEIKFNILSGVSLTQITHTVQQVPRPQVCYCEQIIGSGSHVDFC